MGEWETPVFNNAEWKKMGVSVIQETLYLEKKEWKTVDLGSLSYLKKWAGKKDEIAGPSQ